MLHEEIILIYIFIYFKFGTTNHMIRISPNREIWDSCPRKIITLHSPQATSIHQNTSSWEFGGWILAEWWQKLLHRTEYFKTFPLNCWSECDLNCRQRLYNTRDCALRSVSAVIKAGRQDISDFKHCILVGVRDRT